MMGASLIGLSVLFDIYNKVSGNEKKTVKFARFSDAVSDFRKHVDQLIISEQDISIKWMGITMEYGQPALKEIIADLTNIGRQNRLDIEVSMLDPSWTEVNSLNVEWNEKAKAGFNLLNKTSDDGLCTLFTYKYIPNIHGFILNDKHFYIGTCRWLEGRPDFWMTAGENEYLYVKLGKNKLDDIEAKNFLKWFERT